MKYRMLEKGKKSLWKVSIEDTFVEYCYEMKMSDRYSIDYLAHMLAEVSGSKITKRYRRPLPRRKRVNKG